MVWGALPAGAPEPTAEQILESSREGLVRISRWIDTFLNRLADKPDDQLADTVRLIGTTVLGHA